MAGAGAKLFTSGSVLTADQVNTFLMDQSIMRFTSTTARDAAFGGAGEPTLAEGMFAYTTDTNTLWLYTGSAWQNVLGSNIGEISTDNRNVVINGGMGIWQRGTSSAGTVNNYSPADRWMGFRSANAAGSTFSQSAVTAGTSPFSYALRAQRDSGNTGTGRIISTTSFETLNIVPLRGQILTLSFYARCGANYSATSNILNAQVLQGTGTDGNLAGGFTGQSAYIASTATLTTSFQRFTFTGSAALASNIGQLGVYIYSDPTGTAGANDWYEITGVQLEIGSVATPFEFEDIGTTLAKCQRYFVKTFSQGVAPATFAAANGSLWQGKSYAASANVYFATWHFPVEMRAAPTTVTTYTPAGAGSDWLDEAGGTVTAATGNFGTRGCLINNTGIAAANRWAVIHATASAEL